MAKFVTPEMEKINKANTTRKGGVKQYNYWTDAWYRLKRNPTAVFGLVIVVFMILIGVFADLIAPYGYDEANFLAMSQRPSAEHLFGTDNLGRDLFSRCVYGSRYTLSLALICMCTALLTGGMLGLIASYFGGAVDTVIMRVMDVFQAIPGTLMAITVVATLGTGTVQLVVALTLSCMPTMAKTVRAAIFTVRGNAYILASRAIGSGSLRLMFKHMLPNAVGHIIIYAVGSVSGSIIVIATLSYIGLGIQPPTPEWGALLNAGKEYLTSSPYLVLFPGLMIIITVLSLNLLGNGLRDALDPRLK